MLSLRSVFTLWRYRIRLSFSMQPAKPNLGAPN